MKTIIVTRHSPTVEWLREQGITGQVVAHVEDPAEVRGHHVIGNIPYPLAAEAAKLTMIELPARRAEQRGRELTLEEMRAAGAKLVSYIVRRTE